MTAAILGIVGIVFRWLFLLHKARTAEDVHLSEAQAVTKELESQNEVRANIASRSDADIDRQLREPWVKQ